MTHEELVAAFNDDELDGVFSDIMPTPKYPRDVCAAMKLHDLLPTSYKMISGAEYDVVYFDIDVEALAPLVTVEDIVYLRSCSVYYEEDTDSLAMFV